MGIRGRRQPYAQSVHQGIWKYPEYGRGCNRLCRLSFTMGITDIPVAGGFSIQGFAGGMHIEKPAGFSVKDPGFKQDEYIYPGLELNLTAGYLGVPLRGGLGISGKINPRHPEDFSFAENTGIYFFIGTDSTRSRIF